jgi:hypothetical protein
MTAPTYPQVDSRAPLLTGRLPPPAPNLVPEIADGNREGRRERTPVPEAGIPAVAAAGYLRRPVEDRASPHVDGPRDPQTLPGLELDLHVLLLHRASEVAPTRSASLGGAGLLVAPDPQSIVRTGPRRGHHGQLELGQQVTVETHDSTSPCALDLMSMLPEREGHGYPPFSSFF